MRKQIAAANWKMNLTYDEGINLIDSLTLAHTNVNDNKEVVLAVPFPYLKTAKDKLKDVKGFFVAAQNCYTEESGAYTGEVSAPMLASLHVDYVIIGHSERREIFGEDNATLAKKIRICLKNNLKPIFCCGEPLKIREAETQNQYVEEQVKESLFEFSEDELKNIVIAYEPIWAIGTGRTASPEQAEEMHAHIREIIKSKYGATAAENISILYGGSVKAANAAEIFGKPNVDGGLVGGASLKAEEFGEIIKSLK